MTVTVSIDTDTAVFWATVLLLVGSLVTAVWNIVLPFRMDPSSPISDFARRVGAVASGLAFVLAVVLLVLGTDSGRCSWRRLCFRSSRSCGFSSRVAITHH